MIATHVLVSPLAALALVLLASAPMELPIRWDTPPACVDATEVPARVEALIGSGSVGARSLTLGAEPRGDGWRITIALEPEGTEASLRRTLEGRSCTTLTGAVALVVAVHLDAVAAAKGLEEERSVASPVEVGAREGEGVPQEQRSMVPPVEAQLHDGSVEPQGQPPTRDGAIVRDDEREPGPAVASSRSSSAPRPRPRALASFAAAGEVGVQPRAGAAFELAGGVGWPRARVELGALASVGPDAVSDRIATVGGRFRVFTGLVRGCGVPGRGRLELPLCGGLELGALRGTGTGLQRPARVSAPWIAVVASARPQWVPRLRSAGGAGGGRGRLAFGALFDLVVPVWRPIFETPEVGLVHAVDPVAVRVGLRVELRLP